MSDLASCQTEWIAVDWGTTHVRAWVMDEQGGVLTSLGSEQGMGKLERLQFAPTFKQLAGAYLPADRSITVVCCGMAGSRQGWLEAPYIELPCAPPGIRDAVVMTDCDDGFELRILPGVKQAEPADVMRGEETQIAGFVQSNPEFDGVVCLPGTHTKWVSLKSGRITGFKTFMTGELFALLQQHSVLKHIVDTDGWNQQGFERAVLETLSHPQDFSGALFSLRAQSLIAKLDPVEAASRLSGLLIGVELAAARTYWKDVELALIGSEKLVELYRLALAGQALEPILCDGEAMTLAGLVAAYRELTEVVA